MLYSIALRFDEQLEKEIRSIRYQFDEEGFLKLKDEDGEFPHITMAIGVEGKENDVLRIMNNKKISNRSIRLEPFGVFFNERKAIYLNAVLSEELQRFHCYIYEEIKKQNMNYLKRCAPGSVIFHTTIVRDLDDKELMKAVEVMMKNRRKLFGKIDSIEVWQYPPPSIVNTISIEDKE